MDFKIQFQQIDFDHISHGSTVYSGADTEGTSIKIQERLSAG